MPRHAGRGGAARVRVEVVDDGKHLCVRLHDNGSGIPEAQIDRIFEPFFSTKGEGKGTGLGLSIVRNIIEQHQGQIEVESRAGNGTIFSIYLPCQS